MEQIEKWEREKRAYQRRMEELIVRENQKNVEIELYR